MKKIINKFAEDFIHAVFISFALTGVIAWVLEWNWYLLVSIFCTVFVAFILFGDGTSNITRGWPDWANQIKESIGSIIGGLLFSCFFGIFLMILSLYSGKEDSQKFSLIVMYAIAIGNIIHVIARAFIIYDALAKRYTINKFISIIYIFVVGTCITFTGFKAYEFLQTQNAAMTYDDEPRYEGYYYPPGYWELAGSVGDTSTEFLREDTLSSEQKQIMHLSFLLQTALGQDNVEKDFEKEVGDYVVYETERCWNHWVWMYEIRPKYVSKDHGFINIRTKYPPSDWHYKLGGTGTEILPPVHIQKQVLEELVHQRMK